MKRIALSIVLLYVLAASLSLMSCHSKEVGTDPDDTRPRVLGVDIKQGEFILADDFCHGTDSAKVTRRQCRQRVYIMLFFTIR